MYNIHSNSVTVIGSQHPNTTSGFGLLVWESWRSHGSGFPIKPLFTIMWVFMNKSIVALVIIIKREETKIRDISQKRHQHLISRTCYIWRQNISTIYSQIFCIGTITIATFQEGSSFSKLEKDEFKL